MARQDFNGMDPLGFRWEATIKLAILLSDLAKDLEDHSDDQVLSALQIRKDFEVHGLFESAHVIRPWKAGEDEFGDRVRFDSIVRDNRQRRAVVLRLTSPAMSRTDLVEKLRWGVFDAKRGKGLGAVTDNMSVRYETSVRITHVQQPDVPVFPGSAVGLDSAWRVAVGAAWKEKQPALRSICAIRDARLAADREARDPRYDIFDYSQPEDRLTVLGRENSACWFDRDAMWISGIPNRWLFDQARSKSPGVKYGAEALVRLLLATEVFLGLYHRPPNYPGDEMWRLKSLVELLRSEGTSPVLREIGGRTIIFFRGKEIGEWMDPSCRVRFKPVGDIELWSCPVERKEIDVALAALILDVAWAREFLNDGRHLSSYLGPIAEDYPELHRTANHRLRLDDGNEDRVNPLARFKDAITPVGGVPTL